MWEEVELNFKNCCALSLEGKQKTEINILTKMYMIRIPGLTNSNLVV